MPSQGAVLVGTGLSLGVVHVLTGPDHLSALVTLSANVKSRWEAFYLGAGWGVGHSTGLLIIAIIFLIITLGTKDDKIEIPESLSRIFELLVGVFLLILGVHGFARAWNKRKAYQATNTLETELVEEKENEVSEKEKDVSDDVDCEIVPTPASYGAISTSDDKSENNTVAVNNNSDLVIADEKDESKTPDSDEIDCELATPTAADEIQPVIITNEDEEQLNDSTESNPNEGTTLFQRFATNVSIRTMAVLAGLVHGLAGPGGVLGVIPAVQLHSFKLAAIYLGCFCLSSIVTMGVFATVYASASHLLARGGNANRAFLVEFLSASLSILVGILWLILSSMGIMDKVFP